MLTYLVVFFIANALAEFSTIFSNQVVSVNTKINRNTHNFIQNIKYRFISIWVCSNTDNLPLSDFTRFIYTVIIFSINNIHKNRAMMLHFNKKNVNKSYKITLFHFGIITQTNSHWYTPPVFLVLLGTTNYICKYFGLFPCF